MTTYVLVHGAYQGGWIWQPVAARLRAAGHTVYAPTLDGCAERRGSLRAGITNDTHAAEIVALLFYEDLREVTLVGTSSGGMVISRAAELAPQRVGRLAFVDALALDDGERLDAVVSRPAVTGDELAVGPTRHDAETRLFAEFGEPLRSWVLDRYCPHPVAAMAEPMHLERFWSLPWDALVVRCTRAVNPPEAHQRRTAERLGAVWAELDTGHYPMLSTPDELVALLLA